MCKKNFKIDSLDVSIYSTRDEMGKAAGKAAADTLRSILEKKEYANVIFAAAPSQNEMLEALLRQDINWSRVNAFHMDEYVGLDISDSQSFAKYLYDHIFSKVNFHSVHYLPAKMNVEDGCKQYAKLLSEFPADVVLMGIGENGHIAFNDPPVADFKDPYTVKKVELDQVCRMQQVHDGCFPNFDAVPAFALTLTVPALMSAKHLICTVPGETKFKAVKEMLFGPYGEACPATALRTHGSAKLFLDTDSAKEII